jgi:hypothetical protein
VNDRRQPTAHLAPRRASLRAEFVRLGLRLAFKRSRSQANVASVRRRLEVFGYMVPNPPRDTQVSRLDLDGVPAIQVATPKSRPDRHLLTCTVAVTCQGRRASTATSSGGSPMRPARASRSSITGWRPSIRFRRRWTMR